MEKRDPWLVCRIGKKCCLMAKDQRAYYIIEVGKHLDYETEEWLAYRGISEELLKELKLSFTFIPFADLRGVAIGGSEAGDGIWLYLKSEKRKLTLEMDYEAAWIDGFFGSLHRFTAPKKKKPGDKGWRKERQDKETFERLKLIPPVFMILGLASGVGWMLTKHWLLFTACLVLSGVQLGLALCFPVYFTIFLPKGKKTQNVYNLEFTLWCTGVWLLFGVRGDLMEYGALCWIIPMAIVIAALIYWRVRDLREEPWGLLSCLLICCFIAIYVAGQVNIVYDFTPGETWVLEVEDLESSGGRRGRTYYCTVTLPDSGTQRLQIARGLYWDLEEGDYVRVEQDTGVLGMEYTMVCPVE